MPSSDHHRKESCDEDRQVVGRNDNETRGRTSNADNEKVDNLLEMLSDITACLHTIMLCHEFYLASDVVLMPSSKIIIKKSSTGGIRSET